jgi:hypothetical protein
MTPPSDGMARSLVNRLSADCATAAGLAAIVDSRREGMIAATLLAGFSRSSLDRVAADFEERGWLVKRSDGWYVPPTGMPPAIPSFLAGMAAMREPAAAEEAALTAVTLPHPPSAIAMALPATGMSSAALISTGEAMRRVADAALSRLTVMSPFLNGGGLGRVDGFNQHQAARETDNG